MKVYLGGSLRNPRVREVANRLREKGIEVFDDWASTAPDADDHWKAYEQARGRTFIEALQGHFARNVFEFDKAHLDEADAFVLVLPAGRSAHAELGYMAGCGKRTVVLLAPEIEDERWDHMLQFAEYIVSTIDEVVAALEAF